MIRRAKILRYFGWLAMTAIGLAVVAPVVSQILASRIRMATTGICQEHGAAARLATGSGRHPSPQPMTFCGYCSLFQHSSALTSVDWHAALLPPGQFQLLLAFAIPAWIGHSILAAAPRGPPAFLKL